MKAWEKAKEIFQNESPVIMADDNEVYWEEQSSGPEEAQDMLTKIHWHSQVPGSRAHEMTCNSAIQATENKGYIVEDGMELVDKGLKAYDEGNMVDLHKYEQDIFNACYAAKKDEDSPYWKQTFYDSFEDYEKAVDLPKYEVDLEGAYDRFYAG